MPRNRKQGRTQHEARRAYMRAYMAKYRASDPARNKAMRLAEARRLLERNGYRVTQEGGDEQK